MDRVITRFQPWLQFQFLLLLVGSLAMTNLAKLHAQETIPINQDESKVPAYTLPDPLKFAAGGPVTTPADWSARRTELLKLFADVEFGNTPDGQVPLEIRVVEESDAALDGKAIRHQIELIFGTAPHTVSSNILIYLPKGAPQKPVPVVLGLNFEGNHTVLLDPAIRLSTGWFPDNPKGSRPDHRADEKERGSQTPQWSIENAIDRGYGVATVYYGDFDPDFDDGYKNGVHPFLDPAGHSAANRPGDAWGAIAAWAWGLSRTLDVLVAMPGVDKNRVALLGHSRLGKGALWAAAQDTRFALVISNQSGCGGAALSKRDFGETVKRINTSFPHWFNGNYKKYNGREVDLPVDQHELLALVAPRPLLVCSAAEDLWADPKGEYLGCVGADPVYRLLTGDGLNAKSMPQVNQREWGRLMYHVRPGKHDVTPNDWTLYLDFADRYMTGSK